jgi:transcription antitermination protein NusB
VKTSSDPRHQHRILIFQNLFAYTFGNSGQTPTEESDDIIKKIEKIDDIIKKNAPKWPIDKINKIDLSVLRLAIYELYFKKQTPPKVVLDEAIEIAKQFGADNSSSFVNGVLGTILLKLNHGSKT